jgi:hypothetical protein
LFDLGYYSHDLFATIDKHKGHYIIPSSLD